MYESQVEGMGAYIHHVRQTCVKSPHLMVAHNVQVSTFCTHVHKSHVIRTRKNKGKQNQRITHKIEQ